MKANRLLRAHRGLGPLLAAAAGCLVLAAPAAAASPSHAVRLGRAPSLPRRARVTGPVPEGKPLQLTIALEPRDPAGLEAFATAVSTPGSPSFRHYLSVGQFAQTYGATPAQVAAVSSALRAQGLEVGSPTANDLTLPATGTAAQVESALSVSLSTVRLPGGRTAYANAQAPAVPTSVARYVQGVIGLDNLAPDRPQAPTSPAPSSPLSGLPGSANAAARPQVVTGGPQPCPAVQAEQQRIQQAEAEEGTGVVPYTADQIASAYQFSNLYLGGDLGAGQTVAVFEQEPYQASDVATYQACYGTSASVTPINVDGGPGPYVPGSSEDGEAALDIEQVIGLAPRASVLVYQGPESASAPVDIISAMVSQDRAKVISSSWGECEALTGGTVMNAENTLLQEAAAQGQSFFVSSGDSGSEQCSQVEKSNTSLSVLNPASQPYATGVGGTLMYPIGPPPSEYVWNEGPTFSGATGGGVSAQWPMPSYQSGASGSLGVVNPYSSAAPCGAGGFCREVPDVSADGSRLTGYMVYANSGWNLIGGTSAAAPLWAAFTALANASPACRGIPVGFANPALYQIAGSRYLENFHDVSQAYPEGAFEPNNDMLGAHGGLYPVTPNYDMTTGLGTPVGQTLAASLCVLAAPVYTVQVNSPGNLTSTVGSGVTVQVSATDSGGAPLYYGASGLPAGLSIDPSSGVISGTPTTPGTSTVTVSAGDPYANGGSTQFSWTISEAAHKKGNGKKGNGKKRRARGLRLSRLSLKGVAQRRPKLTFAISALKHTPALSAVTVALPHGLLFAKARRALVKGIRLRNAHGKRVAAKTRVKHGRLRISLSHRQRLVRFTLASPALRDTAKLIRKARQRKVKSVRLTIGATDSAHRGIEFKRRVGLK